MNPLLSVLSEGVPPGLIIAGLLLLVMPWIDRTTNLRVLPIVMVLGLTANYLYWRLTSTIPSIDDPLDFAFGLTFFLIELGAVGGSVVSYVTLTRTINRSAEVERNSAWLLGQPEMPLVDIFICTYNEEREILERTMLGATGIQYPNFRVWVLDDGRRSWLADVAAQLGCNYLTRADNAHAKAGNINNAINHVRGLPEPPDFISILDADFVPTPAFLMRALTLFREDDVGIVQTPQHFINPDPIQANLKSSDVWPDEQRYFFDILMPAKDAWGTAFCCGTSSVIRMAALDQIGGFPTDSVTEDYLLTLRCKRNGFRTVYLNERLSLGLAPEGLREYVTQRSRWCLGFMQIIRGKDGPFRAGNGLALADRLSLIESLLYWSMAYMFRMAGLLVPILYLVFGINAVDVDTADGISHFLPYYIAQITVMAWISGQRVLPVMTDISQLLAARDILTAAFVGLVKPQGQKFKVTAKGGDRSRMIIQWGTMRFFLLLLGLTFLGVVMTFWGNAQIQDSSMIALYWAWYNMVILIAGIAICFETPRLRQHDRLLGGEIVDLSFGHSRNAYVTADISVGGMRLLGQTDAPVGADIHVQVGHRVLRAQVVRKTRGDFAIAFGAGSEANAAMVRHVYSGLFQSPIERISSGRVARSVVARLLG